MRYGPGSWRSVASGRISWDPPGYPRNPEIDLGSRGLKEQQIVRVWNTRAERGTFEGQSCGTRSSGVLREGGEGQPRDHSL